MTSTPHLTVFLQLHLMVIATIICILIFQHSHFSTTLSNKFFFFGPLPFLTVSIIHGEEMADGVITGKQKGANGNRNSLLGNYYRRKNANEP